MGHPSACHTAQVDDNEPHGFLRADSWRAEYRRILQLFETALQ